MNSSDFEFLKKHTKLDDIKLATLLEEDEALIVDAIADNSIDDVITDLSFPFYVKLSIYKAGKDSTLPADDKEYISQSVSLVYPKIYRQSTYIIDKDVIDENVGQLYLVLAGLFPARLRRFNDRGAPSIDFYIKVARTAFYDANRPSIASHIYDCVNVLNKVKMLWKI